MHVLLDEDVPKQVLEVLRHVLHGHVATHVVDLGWSGKPDINLFRDATNKFDALITNNYRQLDDADETKEIKRSGLHHIAYSQKQEGLKGLALSIGAIIASMPLVIVELEKAESQRLVRINGLDPNRRFEITDPRRNPPKYWPR